ncbi:NAD(P)-dependent oxidoreductase [Eikenella sp. S3360]|uniref:NAD(P)-dependent oxidoreductase n=1 Tax=Eikenella glucosivorans TaxID=2766967 RepID=A0ABS0N8F7_9NEIS|nr:NAD(P)-dependent oxidoreductase [Eikenella glucosivorans]MBH5328565.1 NAD(P)-dependent oxidoreductase [Eikenella glucosivorans]
MTILITGATGGLGRNAAELALQTGSPVLALGRNPAALAELAAQGCRTVAADLTRPLPPKLLHGIRAVWHCAALSSPWGRYADFHAANVLATKQLAQAAGQAQVPVFVHISTPSLYFDFHHRRNVSENFRPVRYANHYAATKALAEQRILAAAEKFPHTRFVMLRPRAIFGRHDQVLLPRLLHVIRQRGFLPLPRGGAALMDFTYAPNVAHAMRLATDRPGIPSGSVFNITNQEPLALRQVVDTLLKGYLKLDFPIRTPPYPLLAAAAAALEGWSALSRREPLFTRYSIAALHYDMTLDNRAAQTLLGYTPPHNMQQAMAATARYWHERL